MMGPVAVCSRSFSANPTLRAELLDVVSAARFHDGSSTLRGPALLDFIGDAPCAIIGLETLDAPTLDALPGLRVISKYGVGTDSLDLEALRARGVRLGWTPGVNRRSVSELVLAMTITLLRRVPEASAALREGGWGRFVGNTLTGRTLGIIGFGNVGQDVARLVGPLGIDVIATDVLDRTAAAAALGVRLTTRDEVVAQSDVLTLHVPLDASTMMMLDRAAIESMRPGAILVNLARGGLLDEIALLDALERGNLRGAVLDVFAEEPPPDRALVRHPRVLATPHIGGSSEEAVLAMGRAAIAGLVRHRSIDDIDFSEVV